jgi:PTH1 family peptidyl-tRNA hydrolase
MIKLIILLGNPGRKYRRTRHNIAWMLEDHLSFAQTLSWQKKWHGRFSQLSVDNENRYLLKPETYMNRSGQSVESCMQFYKITPREMLVIHDDIELDFAQIGLKFSGGLGGHNGLRSIDSILKTRDFYRFRLGVSRPDHSDIASYVLSNFSSDERMVLPDYLMKAGQILETCLWDHLDEALDNLNKKSLL